MIPCDFDEIIEKSSRITLSNENFFTQLSTHKALSNITKFLRYQKRGIETNRSYNTSTLVWLQVSEITSFYIFKRLANPFSFALWTFAFKF